MKGDHALYPRYQAAIQQQLQGRHDAIAAQLRDKKEEVKEIVKHREAIGVTLYSAQQQLARLQLQLDQLHDRFAMVHAKRTEDEVSLKQVTTEWEKKEKRCGCSSKAAIKGARRTRPTQWYLAVSWGIQ